MSTAVVWLPFLHNFLIIYANFDGPFYIIPAKTLYNPQAIEVLGVGLNLSPEYFAAHLPLYPLFIRVFAPILGYLKSMLFVNIASTVTLVWLFYFVVKKLNLSEKPLLLASIFLFIPRFLITRSVGAPESLFMLLIFASLYLFEEKKLFWSAVLGGLAAMCKTPGILLFLAYFLVYLEQFMRTRKFDSKSLYILLIPAGLLGVFSLYAAQMGDFFAYFHTQSVVPLLYPFDAFNFDAKWIQTIWLEDILFYFALFGFAVVLLKESRQRSFFYFSLVFLVATTFVQHRDIARYILPVVPFVLIAYEKTLTSKKFMYVALLLLPAVYLFVWNFIGHNVAPIGDWSPFI